MATLIRRALVMLRAGFNVRVLSYLAACLSSALLCSLNGQVPSRPAALATGIDWSAFLGRQDLVWNRLPRGWGESAFIGNGRLGATIDEENGAFGWSVNRMDVVHDESRYPIGRAILRTAGAITGGEARLTLWDAEASGTVRTQRGEIHWRSFVSRSPEVIVVVLDGRGGERGATLDWSPALARPPRKVHNKTPFAPEDLHPPAAVTNAGSSITSVQTFIGGDAHAESIIRTDAANGERVYYVSIGYAKTGDAALREARSTTTAASHRGLAQLSDGERRWWHQYYPESFVSFPDARLQSYYWIQIYKLGAAMRPDGPILDLNGPWFNDTPWPAIWWNLNIQLTYSPLFRANRLGLAESLFKNLDRNRQALIANVPERLRGQAAAIGRSSGPDLVRKVDLATATSDASHEMGDLPWTLFYYWEYYHYTMDDAILRARLYPLLRLAIGNYLAYVQKGEDGLYHLPPTESPELAVVPDASYDLALLRWGLQTLVASATRLRIDDPLLPRWREVLTGLTPIARDSTGLWVGAGRPWKQSHRHYSHLLAIYPLGLITPDRPTDRTLIEASLRTWEREPSLFRGYSLTGGASMHAMLGQGDTALARLNQFLDFPKYMEPNTFYAEAGPVIETPLSAATTIQELFLQDWGSALRVFPAMPSVWKEAAFEHLRGDGAFLVSAVRANGRTAWVRIESLAGAPLRVVVPDWDKAVVRASSGAVPRVVRDTSGAFVFALAKGSWVVLAPNTVTPLPAIQPVSLPAATANPWPMLKPDSSAAVGTGSVRIQDQPQLAWWRESMKTRDQRLQWWRDARFGMFLHWGVYSQLAGMWNGTPVKGYAEHIQRIRRIPGAVYRDSAVDRFNPVHFNADEWVNTARRAGMRYMIITAKHHDGFAMYDSKVSNYNVVAATPFHRDPLRELRDAARRHGMKFGFYYSHAYDWQDPDAPGNDWDFDNPGGDRHLHGGVNWWEHEPRLLEKTRRYVDRKAIPQIVELIRNYDPDIMWFDTPSKLPPEENLRILRAARAAKPDLVINGRAVQEIPGGPEARFGDYASTADRPAELTRHAGDWEAIPTTNKSYGYHRADTTHKPPEHFVRLLAKAAARGGNLLLNIGPMGDGRFDPADIEILEGIGDWMSVNGESIRGTTRTPLPVQSWGQSMQKGNRLYLHVFDWPRNGRLQVAGVSTDVTKAWLLAEPNAPALAVHRLGARDVEIEVPLAPPDRWVSVVVLDCAGPIAADSVIRLSTIGPPIQLHVFDGRLEGSGIKYGDGKRGRDVAEGWNRMDSGVAWDVRISEPARFHVKVEYAAAPADTGTYDVSVGSSRLSARVIPTGTESVFAARDVGEVALQPGEYTIRVRPTRITGGELMRLRRIELTRITGS